MPPRGAIEFWAKLADDEEFRHNFMSVDAGLMREFLRHEGFEFSMEEFASIVSIWSKFGPAALPPGSATDRLD